MAIPSVQPFAMQPGGGIVTSMQGINALRKSNLDNTILKAQAQYAPWAAYADANLKKQQADWLPYQYQMQALSNPLLWASNPAAAQQLMNTMSKGGMAMPNQGNAIPQPQAQSGGIMNALLQKFGMGGSNGNTPTAAGNAVASGMPMPNAPQQQTPAPTADATANQGTQPTPATPAPTNGNTSPLVPATGGTLPGVAGSMTAKYQESPYKEGTTFYDPNTGETYSAPTGNSESTAQTSINAAERVMPQIHKLSTAMAPFMNIAGMGEMTLQRLGNLITNPKFRKENNLPMDMPSKYAAAMAIIKKAPEALIKSYGLNATNEALDRMQAVIEPYPGENSEGYEKRLMDELNSIQTEQVDVAKKNLSSGFQLTNNKNTSKNAPVPAQSGNKHVPQVRGTQPLIVIPPGAKTIQMKTPDGKMWNVPVNQISGALEKDAVQVNANG